MLSSGGFGLSLTCLSVILFPAHSPVIQETIAFLSALPSAGAIYRANDLAHARRLTALCRPQLLIWDGSHAPDAAVEFIFDFKTCFPLAHTIFITHQEVPPEFLGQPQLHLVAPPLRAELFTELLDRALNPGRQAERMAYRAVLDQITLLDVLQIKVYSGASCILSIIGGRGEYGLLVLEKGQLCHATAGRKSGLDAFEQILFWPGGTITEMPFPGTIERTITTDTPSLLMEAARRLDERRATAPAAPVEADTSALRHEVNGRTFYLEDATDERIDQLPRMPKILIADDNPMMLRYADEVLARHWPDHAIVTVSSGAEALQAAREYIPRLMILDLVLPDLSGEHVARQMLENPALRPIPIILISGRIEDLRVAARDCPNVVATLNKPFLPAQLIETVRGAESFVSL